MLQQAIFHKCAATGGIFFAENQPAHSWENLRTVTCFFLRKKNGNFSVCYSFETLSSLHAHELTRTHTCKHAHAQRERQMRARARAHPLSYTHRHYYKLKHIRSPARAHTIFWTFCQSVARALSLSCFFFFSDHFSLCFFLPPSFFLLRSLLHTQAGAWDGFYTYFATGMIQNLPDN